MCVYMAFVNLCNFLLSGSIPQSELNRLHEDFHCFYIKQNLMRIYLFIYFLGDGGLIFFFTLNKNWGVCFWDSGSGQNLVFTLTKFDGFHW
jgi:hypothetical protein